MGRFELAHRIAMAPLTRCRCAAGLLPPTAVTSVLLVSAQLASAAALCCTHCNTPCQQPLHRAIDGIPRANAIEYYSQRATGGQ